MREISSVKAIPSKLEKAYLSSEMKNKKDETRIIIVTPQQRKRLKLGLAERTKIRHRKEQERRERYFK